MKNTSPKSKRNLRPRPLVTAAPITVSDLTSFDLFGLDGRQLRHFVGKHALPHVTHGHRILVRADVLLNAMDRLSASSAADPQSSEGSEVDDDVPETVEGVLRLIGRRLA